MQKICLFLFLSFCFTFEVFAQSELKSAWYNAPDFYLKPAKGKKIKLSDLKGKVVYIDVWASWCLPCIKNMPSLNRLRDQYRHNNDVVIIGVNLDTSKKKWKKAVKKYGLSKKFEVFAENGMKSKFANDYFVQALPHYILIDKNGQLHDSTASGPSSIEDEIKFLLQLEPANIVSLIPLPLEQ